MTIKRSKGLAYLSLFVSTLFFSIFAFDESCGFMTYLIELCLIVLTIVLFNNESLISANSLFAAYFCYSVALGPLFLIYQEIDYGFNYFTVILGSLLCFAWGNSLVANKKFRKPIKDKSLFYLKLSRKWALRIVFLGSFVASAYYLLINREYLLGGSVQAGRIEAMSGNGMVFFLGQLAVLVVPMMYDLYFQGKQDCRKTISKYEIAICASLSLVMLLVSGFRTPFMTLVVCLALLIIQKNNIKNSVIIRFGVLMIIAVEILGMLRNGLSGIVDKGFAGSLSTSLIVNCINLRYVFNTFPVKTPFQHGYTYLINLIMLMPGPDPDFTLWLKDQIGISFAGGGVTPTVIGEFYINFGKIGMYVGMFFLGILGVYVYRYFRRHSDTFLGVFYLWQFAHCVSGGMANVMITILLYTIVYWCLMSCPVYLKRYGGDAYGQRKAIE